MRIHTKTKKSHTITFYSNLRILFLRKACLGALLRLDDRVDRNGDSIKNFPLAQYAAVCWPQHAKFQNVSSRIEDGMKFLFDADKPHFAAWLWIHHEEWPLGPSLTIMSPPKPDVTPLYYAVRLGLRDLSEYLLAQHPEHIHTVGGLYGTPLHVAVAKRYLDVVLLLVGYPPVDVKPRTKDRTPDSTHCTSRQ